MKVKTSGLIGPREFYIRLLTIALPIMVKQGITSFVNMLDNIMVGRISTPAMSGVSIVNQLIFVFNLIIFGGMAGAGIFTAQYYGQHDDQGVRHTFRFKLGVSLLLGFSGIALLYFFREPLIMLYLHEPEGSALMAAALKEADGYLVLILWGLIPFALSQAYGATLSECGDTFLPMAAGIAAVIVNLLGNYVLIFGKAGFPALGTAGAAIATDVSRAVELMILVIYTHSRSRRHPFIKGAFRSFHIPPALLGKILVKGAPLLVNEAMWSMGMSALVRNYSLRGLHVVAALNISTTISNVFNIVFIALGSAIAIIIGQELGAGDPEVRRDALRLTFFAVACCVVSGACLFAAAPFFPRIYNTEESVRLAASRFIMIAAAAMPMYAYENSTYFILRAGGKTFITFLFDACFIWIVSIPLSWYLSACTLLPVPLVYAIVQAAEIFKCLIGFVLVRKGIWISRITV